MKIRSIFIVVFIGYSLAAAAQSFNYLQAAQTYWKYRYRLVGDNVESDSTAVAGEPGFMIRGEETNPNAFTSGLSAPARSRRADVGPDRGYCGRQPDNTSSDGVMDWGDGQGDDLGQYLAVLATEWKLLHDNGESTAKTELELCYALKAFNRYEEFEYDIFGQTRQRNGIFYRDDVPWDFARTTVVNSPFTPYPYEYFGSKYNTVASSASCGVYRDGQTLYDHPNSMSIDQAVKMLWGLVFVRKCLPSSGVHSSGWGGYPGDPTYDLGTEAGEAIHRLINYIKFNPNGHQRWRICGPDGHSVPQGAGAAVLAYPLSEIYNKYSGHYALDAYSHNAGLTIWNVGFENIVFDNGALPRYFNNPDWEIKLMIMRGLSPVPLSNAWMASIGYNIATLCIPGCNGNNVMKELQQEAYSNSGLLYNWPYDDLASAFLNDHSPAHGASFWQPFLTQVPFASTYSQHFTYDVNTVWHSRSLSGYYDYPCEMPVANCTAANGAETLDPNSTPVPDHPKQQFNGLDYMLFYNLYCLEFPSAFINSADDEEVTYCDFQDRIIEGQYPLASMTTDNVGTQAHHAVIGAETSMKFQGSNVASGTYVDFIAPHISAPLNPFSPNQYINCRPGSVCTFTPGRPVCGALRGDNYRTLPPATHLGDTARVASIDNIRTSPRISSDKKDVASVTGVDFKVTVYPNPMTSVCQIILDLPASSRVSIQVNDVYGRLVSEVLNESVLSAGEFNYQFLRDGISSGSYMVAVTINGKVTLKKITVI